MTIVKEAKELNQLIYYRLAEEALATSRAMRMNREESHDRGEGSWGARREGEGDKLRPTGSGQRGRGGGPHGGRTGRPTEGFNGHDEQANPHKAKQGFTNQGYGMGNPLGLQERRKSGGGLGGGFGGRGGRGK